MTIDSARLSEARRLRAGSRLVVASHNAGKVREIAELMAPYDIAAVSAAELGLPEPVEDGETFEANARIKALAAARGSGLPALSDDSGLEVADLDGAPGIYSARWAGPDKDFGRAMERIFAELEARGARDRLVEEGEKARTPRPRANFTCALALAWPDGTCHLFEGKVHGHLIWPPRGEKGFGYDPIFVPDGYDITFGEMEPAAKHAISHRARAFERFVKACLAP